MKDEIRSKNVLMDDKDNRAVSGECCSSGIKQPIAIKPAEPTCAPYRLPGERVEAVGQEIAWTDGVMSTPAGGVRRVKTQLDWRDRVGSYKARWGVGRMNYRVVPGLYAVGNPTAESPVFVSANYKMSFDHLRSALAGRDGWILTLDTFGINVWCAAGKGSFGTDELVRRVSNTALARIVSHRKLVVPQLGASGVSAHQVKKRCGFSVVYGPARAQDLPAFLDAGMKAKPEMRRVRFGLPERGVLVPVELVMGSKYALLAAAAFLLAGGLSSSGYSVAGVRSTGLFSALIVLSAFCCGAIFGPILLPWLPGRAFSVKGAVLGFALVGGYLAFGSPGLVVYHSWLYLVAWALMVPAITSYVVMNFTGASTYTSLSGVLREMRFAVPAQVAGISIGFGLWLAALFRAGGHS